MSTFSKSELIRIWTLVGQEMLKWTHDEPLLLCVANENAWFQPNQTQQALRFLATMLQPAALEKWLDLYPRLPVSQEKTVGVVMAGNLPLVGFHDWLCVLSSGHRLQVKLSRQDTVLFLLLHEFLADIAPLLRKKIEVVEQLNKPDAVIATGSDNTSRYFDYYFRSYPSIIRKNRTGVAVLTGNESREELIDLGRDIFDYFGLGCRNVSFLLVPEGYDWQPFWLAMEEYQSWGSFYKFRNNYDYQKAILLVNQEAHMDNGFLLLRPETKLASSIGVLHYQTYQQEEEVKQLLLLQQDKIQCVVSSLNWPVATFPFGQAQCPGLSDYADGVDVMKFLSDL